MPGDFTTFSDKFLVSYHWFVWVAGSRGAETASQGVEKDGSESSSIGKGVQHRDVCDLQVLA